MEYNEIGQWEREASEIAWKPQPRQEFALQCPADELLFGGAAGGGKSDFLLADYLYGIKYGKDYAGVLFRRSFPELDELIKRSFDLYGPLGATYNKSSHEWNFPTGAMLKLRYLETDEQVTNYQGHQYQWIGWDELGNYRSDFPYRYMMSRVRSAVGVPCRVRATANPGGVGNAWIRMRFIDDRQPDKLYRDEETGNTLAFVPSRLEDNQILMQNDPKYEKRLLLLPPHLQRALRYGEWDVFSGQVFDEFRREQHIIKPIALGNEWKKFVAMDWGYSRPYSIGWWAVSNEGRMIRYREMYGCKPQEPNMGLKRSAAAVAREAYAFSIGEGVDTMIADPACWSKIESDAPSIAETFMKEGWKLEKGDNSRLNGLQRVHDLLSVKGSDNRPLLMVFSTCFAFIRTIPTLVSDPHKPEDIDTAMEDHVYDETRYACMSRYSTSPHLLKPKRNLYSTTGRAPAFNPLEHGL